jgi:hypothetical protein
MHSPSMLTPLLANEVIAEHTLAARTRRDTRRGGTGLFGRFRRRHDHGPQPLAPGGRTFPRIAH